MDISSVLCDESSKSKEKRMKELFDKQRKDINTRRKLGRYDIKKIIKYTETSLFDDEECCIWTGYITHTISKRKGEYVNFHFKGGKVGLHRLLYENYKGKLSREEYIKYECENRGKCCNVNHMRKYKYITDGMKGRKKVESVTELKIKSKELNERKKFLDLDSNNMKIIIDIKSA
jgi:hypothetical protein